MHLNLNFFKKKTTDGIIVKTEITTTELSRRKETLTKKTKDANEARMKLRLTLAIVPLSQLMNDVNTPTLGGELRHPISHSCCKIRIKEDRGRNFFMKRERCEQNLVTDISARSSPNASPSFSTVLKCALEPHWGSLNGYISISIRYAL